MAEGDYLNGLEQIVLEALLHLGENAYGMAVRRKIQERTGREVAIGTVYATLERLSGKGFVASFAGEPTPERGGRAKRFFRIEARGLSALQRSQDALGKMLGGLKTDWGTT